jgi:hypothetical protein
LFGFASEIDFGKPVGRMSQLGGIFASAYAGRRVAALMINRSNMPKGWENCAMANIPSTSQHHEIFLEEEISDVSLATFYVFDKENAGAPPLARRLKGCNSAWHVHADFELLMPRPIDLELLMPRPTARVRVNGGCSP